MEVKATDPGSAPDGNIILLFVSELRKILGLK
jgi:hypothetical protein